MAHEEKVELMHHYYTPQTSAETKASVFVAFAALTLMGVISLALATVL